MIFKRQQMILDPSKIIKLFVFYFIFKIYIYVFEDVSILKSVLNDNYLLFHSKYFTIGQIHINRKYEYAFIFPVHYTVDVL